MSMTLKTLGSIIIVCAVFLGVRYIGSVIHYACLVPEEDCPPPFRVLADVGFFVTGGELVPLWRQD